MGVAVGGADVMRWGMVIMGRVVEGVKVAEYVNGGMLLKVLISEVMGGRRGRAEHTTPSSSEPLLVVSLLPLEGLFSLLERLSSFPDRLSSFPDWGERLTASVT